MSTDLKTAQERSSLPSGKQTEDLSAYERDLQTRLFSAVLLFPSRFREWMQNWNDDLYIRIDDKTRVATYALPTGSEIKFSGASVPSGFSRSDGAAVPRKDDYASLFAALGTANGAGDGSTTFNKPNTPGYIVKL